MSERKNSITKFFKLVFFDDLGVRIGWQMVLVVCVALIVMITLGSISYSCEKARVTDCTKVCESSGLEYASVENSMCVCGRDVRIMRRSE